MGRKTVGLMEPGKIRFLLLLLCIISMSTAWAQEAGNCGDGIDNDGDGLIDCYDGDCSGSVDCDGFYFGGSSGTCQSTPAPGEPFTLVKVWDTDATMYPMDSRQTALVGDIDSDGDTEVVGIDDSGRIYAFSGVDGSLVMQITTPSQDVQTNATAFADVDGDGFSEFFIVIQNGGSPKLVRYDPDGAATLSTATWTSTADVGHGGSNDDRYTPEIADFDEDGVPEVYLGDQIFNSTTGARIVSGSGSRGEHTAGEPFSVAADVLPDAACANCTGLELVAGNEVYSVDIGTGTFTLEVSAPVTLNDGVTSIVDWDLDGDLDAIVNEGRYVYAWDIQTSAQLGTTFDIRSASVANTTANGGHANIADFDSDGRPEIGLAGRHVYVVIDDFSSGMGELWSTATVDNSQRTGSTVYDFHADGFFEVIYRDEQTLYVYNGLDGSVMASIACGAGTRMEYPVVADANDDGQSEIICPCQDGNGPGNSGNNYISMFRSTDYPWVAARSVWNQHNYFEVSINDDLTVPIELQDHSLVPGSNNFLAQSTYRLSNGSAALAAPDATVTITAPIDKTNCGPAPYEIDATVDISNSGDWPLPASTPISFYNGDPYAGGATLMLVDELGSQLDAGNMTSVTYTLPEQHQDFDLYVLINHNGLALPPAAPDYVESHVGECDFSNNLFGPLTITDCQSPPIGVDASVILNENSSNGTSVHTVAASDPDVGATRTFSITGGNTGTTFDIDMSSGEITVNDNTLLDFSIPVFTLTVTVEDNDGLTDDATITITIDDESVYTVNAAQNEDSYSNGDQLASVTDGNGAIASAVIASGSLPGWMSLNATTGEITVNDATQVADGTYAVDITTTDAVGGTTTQTVSIVIDPDTEAVYTVNAAQNEDSYSNGDQLASVADADGAITSAVIASGSLPSWMSLNATTGEITVNDATQVTDGTYAVDITTTDADGGVTTQTVSIVIDPDTEAVYTVNAAQNEDSYSNGDQLASVADADGAITNAVIASGSLPSWMSLNATTGEITVNDATQVADGTYAVDITTTDADGGVTTQTVSIVINADTEAVYTVNAAQNEDSYSNGDQLASVADADGAITSAVIASGSLPGWMSLNATTGEITVNDATQVADGTYTVDITTTDVDGGVTTQTVSIVIDPDTEAVYTVNAAQNEDSYSNGDQLASVADTDGAITSAVIAGGTLPAWMSLNAATGEITVNDATQVANGTYTVDITTTDVDGGSTTQTVSIVINPDTEAVYTVNAAQNEDGYSNGDQLASVADADGAITSAVIASGSLPTWMSLNATTGEITVNDATQVADGTYAVDITTTDADGGVTTQTVSIVINADTEAIYTVNASQNEDSYSNGDQLASVADTDGAITSAVIASGSLPTWMSLNATTGEITVNDATQVADGTYAVDITTTDADGGVTTQTVSIVIDPDTEAVYTVNAAQNEDSYSNGDQLASVADADGAITSAVIASGSLPSWMSLNATTGEITVNNATQVADGTYAVDITTTDADGGVTTQTVSIVINADTEAVYTVNAAQNEDSYSNGDQLASVADVDGAITSAVIASGSLPSWMSLNATTGEITVNDATQVADGTYIVDITTTDADGGVTTQTVSIVINADTEAVYTVNAAQNEDSYSNSDQLASVADVDGAITSAVIASGSLPSWMSLNATTGEITVNDATQVADGTYAVDITTTDADGGVTTQTVSIVIDPDTEAVYTVNAAQ
ncbi:putative Ig domain-containing protein, partial [Fulvivirgaceae bacterium BMA12]|nr:putative Ig domain-containing protein [Fulvivirgaceae bacterium BMA12]